MQLGLLVLALIPCIFAKNISTKIVRCPLGDQSNGCPLVETNLRIRRQINYGMRMLGEECIWTNQCRQTPVDGTKVCLAHRCRCSHGYIPIDTYRCVRDFDPVSPDMPVTNSIDSDPRGYGSECSTNSDCQQSTTQLRCLQGKCTCFDGYVPLGKYLCYNLRGQSTQPIESSTIISTAIITTSTERFFGNEVMKSLGKIGNSCTNDYFCRRAVSQSHCYNGKCTCFDGYISIDQYTCMKTIDDETTSRSTSVPVDYKSLLGGKCQTKRNCHTSNAMCVNSVCTCPKGHFPVDDWTCLREPESSDEELMDTTSINSATSTAITTLSTTTVFRWWPWSPSPTTRPPFVNLKNSFRVRCLLNRQCASMDKNSHCTLFGRCICNPGYELKATKRGQRCLARTNNEDDCD